MTAETVPDRPSLGELLREQASSRPYASFLEFGGETASFQEADRATDALADALRQWGVEAEARVALFLRNGFDPPLLWLALAKLGAIAVPINSRAGQRDLEHVIDDAGVEFLVGDDQLLEGSSDTLAALPISIASCDGLAGTLQVLAPKTKTLVGQPEQRPIEVSPETVLNLQFTSGTTGLPKACVLSHGYWSSLGWLAAHHVGLNDTDRALTAQPFSYIDPLWNVAMCLRTGATLVILDRFSPSSFWSSVRATRATFVYLVATMPVFLLRQPPHPDDRDHDVRAIVCSGITPNLHQAFEDRWGVPFREAYGMTETGVDLSVPFDDAASVGSGAVGWPVPSKEIRLVDLHGADVPDGEVGQLLTRGIPMMQGYWNRPAETAQALVDGWMHTGDLARRDERGAVHLVGRLRDMVRRAGENISAAEVEAALAEHPGVAAAAVVGVPDELRGEEVKAFVQPADGANLDLTQVREFVAGRLAAFKVPRYLQLVESFPMTPSERVAKHELLDLHPDTGPDVFDGLEPPR